MDEMRWTVSHIVGVIIQEDKLGMCIKILKDIHTFWCNGPILGIHHEHKIKWLNQRMDQIYIYIKGFMMHF